MRVLPADARPGADWSVRLRRLPVDDARALLAGAGAPAAGQAWHPDYPMAETLGALELTWGAHRAVGWREDGTPSWWLHQIVLGGGAPGAVRAGRALVVGDAGFHGPPGPDGEVELGYHVVPELRGRGIATRACGLLLEQAWRDGADRVRARTDPGNDASVRVLLRSGFTRAGRGGDDYLARRPRTPAAGAA